MKTYLCIVLSLLFACTLPAFAQDSSASDSDAKIKALEAELAALRAQLQAQQEIRGGDRRRAPDGRNNMHEDRRRPHHGMDRGMDRGMDHGMDHGMDRGMDREIQIDFTVDSEGDLENMPEFIREMVMSQMAGEGMGHEGDRRDRHHQVMEFSLADVAPGMNGDVRIEFMGDAGMHLSPEAFGMAMSAMMGGEDWDEDERMVNGDEIIEKIVWIMQEHGMPMELLKEVMEEHEVRNEHDVIIGMDMLIDRISREGHDPGPIMELRHGIIERLEGRGEGHHDVHHEDPYMQQGGEFVAKMFLSEEIANVLSDQRAVSIFCIWEARQHLEPQERLDALFPIMINDQVDIAVRNAAAMVVRQSFYELGDREKAIETLRNQILSNEGLLD